MKNTTNNQISINAKCYLQAREDYLQVWEERRCDEIMKSIYKLPEDCFNFFNIFEFMKECCLKRSCGIYNPAQKKRVKSKRIRKHRIDINPEMNYRLHDMDADMRKWAKYLLPNFA